MKKNRLERCSIVDLDNEDLIERTWKLINYLSLSVFFQILSSKIELTIQTAIFFS